MRDVGSALGVVSLGVCRGEMFSFVVLSNQKVSGNLATEYPQS